MLVLIRQFLLIFAALIISSSCLAAAKLYAVEIVVFQRLAPDAPTSDLWVNSPLIPNTEDSVELKSRNANNDRNFQLLPAKDYHLQAEANALARSGKYRVILHKAWTQLITDVHQSQLIHIYGGLLYDENGQVVNGNSATTPTFWQVDGTLQISFSRYFEVQTNLQFTVPAAAYPAYASLEPPAAAHSSLMTFRMLQTRRMKTDELNYLDHPIFGVLLKISPV